MKKTTQLPMLLIALFFMNAGLNAQSGDYEYLFNTDGDAEGFVGFNNANPLEVSGGVMTYTYEDATDGFQMEMPTPTTYLDKNNYPYMAIKLSHTPASRVLMYLKTAGTGAWYKNKIAYGEADTDLNNDHIFFFDISGDNFTTSALNDGAIERIILALDNTGDLTDPIRTTVDVEWIKTFVSIQAIKNYVEPLSNRDVANRSLTKIISGENKIDIVKCELNAKVQIFDLLGKQLHSSVAQFSNVSIPFYNQGVYIVKITGEASVFAKKILLK
ncbi:T9SS type A sorting domain-containing protein [Algibacter sp. L3A6]|uniref:T9SS type A sorting domain-containing protein n=1 Tax=Algibacter sp. L3A6 TaxID=2686366 RepID=UPI00131DC4E9|nr:T9SS type A sorting domain-containing protein [Algibacter sp. L3A6]